MAISAKIFLQKFDRLWVLHDYANSKAASFTTCYKGSSTRGVKSNKKNTKLSQLEFRLALFDFLCR